MTTQNSLNNQTVNANFTVNRTDSGSQAIDAVVHSQNTAGSDAKHRMQVAGTSAGDPFVEMAVGATRSWAAGVDTSATNQPFKITSDTAGNVTPSTGTIAASYVPFTTGTGGISILQATQPNFIAFKTASTANVTGDGTVYTVICDNESFDVAGEYDSATGIFTAAFNANYLFVGAISLESLGAGHTQGAMIFQRNGLDNFYVDSCNYAAIRITAGGNYTAQHSVVLALQAGDTVRMQTQVSNSTLTVGVSGSIANNITYFSAYLLG